jgi:hypothetical protein
MIKNNKIGLISDDFSLQKPNLMKNPDKLYFFNNPHDVFYEDSL